MRIVIADDHPIWRSGIRHDLGDNFEVVGEAGDAAEAVEVIRSTSPDLVLSDLHMPGGGGLAVVQACGQQARIVQGSISLGTVASAWLLIHTMYAMRYARHWFNAEEGCIDFHTEEPPAYSDFLYTAFTIGTSFAISDTDLTSTTVRRIAMRHIWLSYVFGTVIVAATIGLLTGLAA